MRVKIRTEKFRERMAIRNISVTDLAEKVKVGHSYISQVIAGHKFASPKARKKIMNTLGIKEAEWFLYFEVV